MTEKYIICFQHFQFQGKDGVKHVINILRTEFDYALRLSGYLFFIFWCFIIGISKIEVQKFFLLYLKQSKNVSSLFFYTQQKKEIFPILIKINQSFFHQKLFQSQEASQPAYFILYLLDAFRMCEYRTDSRGSPDCGPQQLLLRQTLASQLESVRGQSQRLTDWMWIGSIDPSEFESRDPVKRRDL